MGAKEDIQKEIDRLQRKLNAFDRIGEDIYPLGTVIVFSSSINKWYYVKEGEESWGSLKNRNSATEPLSYWIMQAEDTYSGYFEVYVLVAQEVPIYTKSV